MTRTAHMLTPRSMTSAPDAELPWEWFDESEFPRKLRGQVPNVNQGGAAITWQVQVAGRLVPFKLFRREAATGRKWLLMLPGMGVPIASFRGVAGYLFATHDLAVIDYAALGVEQTHWPAGGVAIRAMAEVVWAVADAIGAKTFDLAGNSLGGAMCLVAALSHANENRIQRMVLANPACYPQMLPFMYRLARVPLLGEFMMATMHGEKLVGGLEHIGYVDKARFLPELRARYLSTMRQRRNRFRLMEMIRHLPGDHRDMTVALHVPRLSELKLPVMVSWGLQDPLLTAGAGERLARDLPNAVYRAYPDLSHMPQEEAPERIGPEWAAFLNASGDAKQ